MAADDMRPPAPGDQPAGDDQQPHGGQESADSPTNESAPSAPVVGRPGAVPLGTTTVGDADSGQPDVAAARTEAHSPGSVSDPSADETPADDALSLEKRPSTDSALSSAAVDKPDDEADREAEGGAAGESVDPTGDEDSDADAEGLAEDDPTVSIPGGSEKQTPRLGPKPPVLLRRLRPHNPYQRPHTYPPRPGKPKPLASTAATPGQPAPPAATKGRFPWWGWLGVVLAAVVVLGLVACFGLGLLFAGPWWMSGPKAYQEGACVIRANSHQVEPASCSESQALKIVDRIEDSADVARCPANTNVTFVHRKGDTKFVLCLAVPTEN